MKYYRTYIFHFLTSTGIKVYAGKHESKHKDPSKDRYNGSGDVISAAVAKYGKQCIINKQWFDHESYDAMNTAEKELIELVHSECDNCVNFANGGEGGNTMKYMSDERKSEVIAKRSASLKKTYSCDKMRKKCSDRAKSSLSTPEAKANMSAAAKLTWSNHRDKIITAHKAVVSTEAHRNKISNASKNMWAENRDKMIHSINASNTEEVRAKKSVGLKSYYSGEDGEARRIAKGEEVKRRYEDPEARKRASESAKKALRKGKHWEEYDILYAMWIEHGCKGYKAIRKMAVAAGYPDIKYTAIHEQFKRDFNGVK